MIELFAEPHRFFAQPDHRVIVTANGGQDAQRHTRIGCHANDGRDTQPFVGGKRFAQALLCVRQTAQPNVQPREGHLRVQPAALDRFCARLLRQKLQSLPQHVSAFHVAAANFIEGPQRPNRLLNEIGAIVSDCPTPCCTDVAEFSFDATRHFQLPAVENMIKAILQQAP